VSEQTPEKTGRKSDRLGSANGPDSTLFISYRISDTGLTATWLSEKLAEAYGHKRVFLDHERLEGGAVWPERLAREAQRASVMLVLIGEGWLRAQDPETGVRRLDQEGDWVRKEIETALDTGALVVPVLVEQAKPLSRDAFATVPSLVPLADRQVLTLRRKDWASDLERLQRLLAANGFERRQSAARPFTIPSPVADFTGRETEIAELEKALTRNGRAAICAVNGLGGVGKSQLAFEVARHMAGHFPDGQVYLDLRGTAPDPLTPEAALAELIRAVHPDAKPPAELAHLKALHRQAWRERQALLLLDNARDETQVRDLVPPAPVAMLVTSRRHILPEGGRMMRLDVLPEPQAIGLVREVLGTARTLAEQEAHELVQACGRLPLALRAAASFLLRRSGWSVAEYLAELRGRKIAALDKVETVLGLSLDRLADEDGELAQRFTLLGAFPAGFDVAAAAALWQIEPRAARDALDALAEWSLVQVEAVGRYRLHDLVRDLAVRRAAPAVLGDAQARHARHYGEVLARANDLYLSSGDGVLQGLSLFDAERVNIEAGHRWAVGNARSRDDAAALVARSSSADIEILILRLTPRQQIEWHDAELAVCQHLGDRRGESYALGGLGTAWAALGEARKAIEFYEQWLAIAREIGDRRSEGNALGGLGTAWAALGEARRAIEFYEQWLAIARKLGDRCGESAALGNLGNA
jgi:tetratricopeptide (TPR) repeat protein